MTVVNSFSINTCPATAVPHWGWLVLPMPARIRPGSDNHVTPVAWGCPNSLGGAPASQINDGKKRNITELRPARGRGSHSPFTFELARDGFITRLINLVGTEATTSTWSRNAS